MNEYLKHYVFLVAGLFFQQSYAIDSVAAEKEIINKIYCSDSGEACQSLSERMKHYHVPGVSIAVLENGKITWAKGYGESDIQAHVPVTTETRFQACSISKAITAVAILELAQKGVINLDQNVNEILKTWQVPPSSYSEKEAVTIRKLLNHTAGFATGRRPMLPLDHALPTTIQILNGQSPAISEAVKLEFIPGSRWQYSGAGYTILQLILEEQYHESFEEILRKQVLEPLGMTNSSFIYPVPSALIPKIAKGYTPAGKAMEVPWYNIADLAAGGLWSTPSDLAKFMTEIQKAHKSNSKLLSLKRVEEMLTPYQENFGLGLKVGGEGATKWFGHGGDNAGYKAVMIGFLEGGQGAAIMTNSDNGWLLAMEILKRIGIVYQWPVEAPQRF